MKKNILLLIGFLLVTTLAIAAGPFSQDPSIYFNAADQETSEPIWINCVFWVSDDLGTATDIASADTFQLTDAGSGNVIISKTSLVTGEGLEVCFPGQGVPADGVKVEEMQGGIAHIIKTRR